MKGKAVKLSFLVLMVSVSWGFSQQKQTYFRIQFGYDFRLASGAYGTSTLEDGESFSQKVLSGSFGNGFNLGITGGYYLMDRVSLELGYEYAIGSERLYRNIEYNDTYSLETRAKSFNHLLRTGGIFYFPLKKADLTLFTNIGILWPVKRRVIMDSSIEGVELQSGYSFTTDQTEEFLVHFSPGFYASIGAVRVLTKQFKVFGELGVRAGSGRFTSSKLTRYRWTRLENGTEHVRELYNLSTAERYTNHLTEITGQSNTPTNPGYDEDAPTDKLTTFLPMSCIGIHVGIIYTFKWQELLGIKKKRS